VARNGHRKAQMFTESVLSGSMARFDLARWGLGV
jgi:hypothetical protein